jgi:hypothetical protein
MTKETDASMHRVDGHTVHTNFLHPNLQVGLEATEAVATTRGINWRRDVRETMMSAPDRLSPRRGSTRDVKAGKHPGP